ncbi:MAG: UDP-glucuronate decarboxylase, partial [uncultured Thermomicrobiales bacterium]
ESSRRGWRWVRRLPPVRAVNSRRRRRNLHGQPLHRPRGERRPARRAPKVRLPPTRRRRFFATAAADRPDLPPRESGQPARVPAASNRDAPREQRGHAPPPRTGGAGRSPLSVCEHLAGLRRPAGAPPAGDVPRQRRSGRSAGDVRRGEALRRGPHAGLRRVARGRDPHRPHLQHLRSPPRRCR